MTKKSFITGFIDSCKKGKAEQVANPDYPRREFIRKKWGILAMIFMFLFVPIADSIAKYFKIDPVITDYPTLIISFCLAYAITIKKANKKFGVKAE